MLDMHLAVNLLSVKAYTSPGSVGFQLTKYIMHNTPTGVQALP